MSNILNAQLLLLFLCMHQNVLAYMAYEDLQFVTNITKGYDSRFRPVLNRSEEVKINVKFSLQAVIELDDKKEIFVTRGWLAMSWHDKILRWDVTEHTPSNLAFTSSEIWTPSVYIVNDASDQSFLKNGREMTMVYNTGDAVLTFTGTFQTQCKVNTAKFPFDEQNCKIKFTTAGRQKSKEYIEVTNHTVGLQYYEDNGEWELGETSLVELSENKGTKKSALVIINLKRRASFYVINTLLPVMMTSILNTFVFLLPEESGDKMTMSISILLSYAVFLSLISSYIPENSDNICFFTVYLVLLLFLSTMTCLATLSSLVAFHRLQKGERISRYFVCLKQNDSVKDVTEPTNEKRRDISRDDIIARTNTVLFWAMFAVTLLVNVLFLLLVMT